MTEPVDGADAAALVVERVTTVNVDGVSRARQVTIVGNLTR